MQFSDVRFACNQDLQKLTQERGRQQQQMNNSNNEQRSRPTDAAGQPPDHHARDSETAPSPVHVPGDVGEVIGHVSDLVDKYWNGSKSLLKSVRFKSTWASQWSLGILIRL